jgi:regulator of PEP synthase PpsR (kinase-PPPase family)
MHLENLPKAEIVLTGVSRTFKTPLSIYMAFKGWLVANVPIILDMKPPPVLFEIPENRVFALTAEPQRLAELRKTRHNFLGGPSDYYFNVDYVYREVGYALDIFKRKPGWRVIEVTNKSIEEIAAEIIALKPGR